MSIMSLLWTVLLALAIVLVAFLIILLVSYSLWHSRRLEQVQEEAIVVETESGPLEYWMKETGPTAVMSHGGPRGYGQGNLISDIVDEGFQVLSLSRPRYLRTPLIHNSIRELADPLNALLEELGI